MLFAYTTTTKANLQQVQQTQNLTQEIFAKLKNSWQKFVAKMYEDLISLKRLPR